MAGKLFEKEMPGAKSVSGAVGNPDCSIGYLRGLRRPLCCTRGAVFVASLFMLAACSGKPEGKAAPTSKPGAVRSACEVLTGEDVSAILGQTLKARPDSEDQGPSHSSCGYYPG